MTKGIRAGGGASLCVVALLVAGCTGPAGPTPGAGIPEPFDPFGAGLPPLSTVHAKWAVLAINATVEHDAAAKTIRTVQTFTLENRYHKAVPAFFLVTLGRELTKVTLADGTPGGRPVEFHKEEGSGSPTALAFEILAPAFAFNITMLDPSPGARATLVVESEGWESYLFLGGASTGTDLPLMDLNSQAQLTVLPIPDTYTTADLTLTMTRPADWTYAVSAFPIGPEQHDAPGAPAGTVTQTFRVRSNMVVVDVGKGMASIRETVSGYGAQTADNPDGDVEVVTHFFPDMAVQGRAVHEITKRALRVLADFSGPYPYSSIQTMPAKMTANAMSAPGLTTLGIDFYRGVLPAPNAQGGRSVPFFSGGEAQESVTVHEFNHNWWGQQVTFNNTSPALGVSDAYVSEGITVFLSEMAFQEHVYGAAHAAASAEGKWRDQQQSRLDGTERPVTAGGDFYEKGALALRALHAHFRFAHKEPAFWQVFRDIQDEYALRNGGPAVIRHPEVAAAFERAYGTDAAGRTLSDLGDGRGFFEVWFDTTELPDIELRSADAAGAAVANAGTVPVPVDVRFTDATGNENTTAVWLSPGESATLRPGGLGPIVRIVADPDWRLDEARKDNNVWGAVPAVLASPIA